MRRCILADMMGLGKTAQVLMSLPDRGLIVCPPSLKYNWKDENEIWRPDLKPVVCEGLGLARFKWPDKGELVICGYNQLPDWMDAPPHKSGFSVTDKSKKAKLARAKLKKERKAFQSFCESQERHGRGTILVADEVQYVKNPKSQRSRKFRILSALCARTWGLTGTPMPRGNSDDTYGILKAMHLENVVFRNFKHYEKVADISWDHFGARRVGTPSPEFHRLLNNVMLRRTKEVAAPHLPPKVHRILSVPLEDFAVEKLNGLSPEFIEKIRYANTASELTQLQSLPEFSEFSMCRKLIARARIPAMLELVEMYEEQGVRPLVFSAHREPIEALAKRKGWGIIIGGMEAEEKQEICRSQVDFLGVGLTIGAGNSGLNLASFSHMIFVDDSWDITQNTQAEDRMHRHGQKADTVFYTRLTSEHPIDRLITEKLANASRNISIVIDGK